MENMLIVDDEKSLLDLLVRRLQEGRLRRQDRVRPASRPMRSVEKEAIDLVITDIKMPQTSGMDVLKFVKEA